MCGGRLDGGGEASLDDGVCDGLGVEGALVLNGDGGDAVLGDVHGHAGDAGNFADLFADAHSAVVAGQAGCLNGGGAHDEFPFGCGVENLGPPGVWGRGV